MTFNTSQPLRVSRLYLLALAALAAVLLAACSTPQPPAPSVTSVAVTAPTTLVAGRTAQALADVAVTNGANTDVDWSTSDSTVATVSAAGLIAALADGNVTITATSRFDATKSDSVDITVSSALRGATVLYYVDDLEGADAAFAALEDAAAQFGAVVVETDDANFVADLGDAPDLVVYLRQSESGIPDDAEAALLDWVSNGGALVFTSWDYLETDVATQLAAMEAVATSSENYLSMEVEEPALGAGLSTSTISIVNPDEGWGTFSLGLQATGDGVELAHFYDGTPELTTDAALVSGNGGKTMVIGFLSDTVDGVDGARLLRNVFEYVMLATLP